MSASSDTRDHQIFVGLILSGLGQRLTLLNVLLEFEEFLDEILLILADVVAVVET